MIYGVEITYRLHRAANQLRRVVRDGLVLGLPPDSIRDMVRSNMAALADEIVGIDPPCGTNSAEPPVVRLCERERGHGGEHFGNL